MRTYKEAPNETENVSNSLGQIIMQMSDFHSRNGLKLVQILVYTVSVSM